jgi:hypothetical protein
LFKIDSYFGEVFLKKKDFTPSELVNSYILEEYSASIFRSLKRLIVLTLNCVPINTAHLPRRP